MNRNKTTVTLDNEFAHPVWLENKLAGATSVQFDSALPTMDDGVAFYVSQLAHIESTLYKTPYAEIDYAVLVPFVSDIPEWADEWNYISYDGVTMGKFIGSSAKDLPRVTVDAKKSKVAIGYAGIGYDYSLDEMRKTAQLRMPIDVTKAELAFRGAQEHQQRVAYFGDASRDMTGLFNNPNLALDSFTINLFTATGAAIVAEVNNLLTTVWTNSKSIHLPNTLVITPALYASFSSRRMDSGTDTTIMQFLMLNNLYTTRTKMELSVEPRYQLEAAELAANGVSNGSKDRMMAYEKNARNLGLANPLPFRQTAPQIQGLNIAVDCEYKMSGVEFRFPFSGAYRDAL
jgi:hypothetical protein